MIKEVYEQTRESAITGFDPINLGGWQRLAKVLKQKFSLYWHFKVWASFLSGKLFVASFDYKAQFKRRSFHVPNLIPSI